MPAPLRFKPQYFWATTVAGPLNKTAQANITHIESAHPLGRLKLESHLTVSDSTNADTAYLSHQATCVMKVVPNGLGPMTVTAIFRPVLTVVSGTITDEVGFSGVNVNWMVKPICWMFDGTNMKQLTQVAPAIWRQHTEFIANTHAWGPIRWPAGAMASAIWTYTGILPPEKPFHLYVGIECIHQAFANDVSIVSDADAEFHLDTVLVQLS
jgi:hypothetical protein